MKHYYNELNDIEKAIVDDLTKGWYIGAGEASTDALNTFYFAYDSVEACNAYNGLPSIDVASMKNAIVGRYNATQAKK